MRPAFVVRPSQDRGWTPARLADALKPLRLRGLSEKTLQRKCASGEISCEETSGGHFRIDDAWVRRMFPSLATLEIQADDETAQSQAA